MAVKCIQLIFLLSVSLILINIVFGSAVTWNDAIVEGKTILKNCTKQQTGIEDIWKCMQNGSLQYLDAVLSSDVVPLYTGIRLIRFQKDIQKRANLEVMNRKLFNLIETNKTGWAMQVIDRFILSLKTHVMQFDLEPFTGEVGRHRHRSKKMWPMMLLGITAVGMVLIPMGFQFLAVLGGKALLLSKMALLLASLQGLKKTTGVTYSLYPHYDHLYDRHEQGYPAYPAGYPEEIPRTSQNGF